KFFLQWYEIPLEYWVLRSEKDHEWIQA
ncbi:hypothetical protein CPC197_1064B, partial [Chlamydia psittaci C1/97]